MSRQRSTGLALSGTGATGDTAQAADKAHNIALRGFRQNEGKPVVTKTINAVDVHTGAA